MRREEGKEVRGEEGMERTKTLKGRGQRGIT
jgi:hypothetical protein